MKSYKYHFLDANVITKAIAGWYDLALYPKAKQYVVDHSFSKITSMRVFSECYGFFSYRRPRILKFLRYLFRQKDSLNYTNLKDDCKSLARQYFTNARDFEQVWLFVDANFAFVEKSILLASTETSWLNTIIAVFDAAFNILSLTCQPNKLALVCRYDKCPAGYFNVYPNELKALNERIYNQKDVLILLDSYYCQQFIKNPLAFITHDYIDILNNKAHIEKTLQNICLFSEASF